MKAHLIGGRSSDLPFSEWLKQYDSGDLDELEMILLEVQYESTQRDLALLSMFSTRKIISDLINNKLA